MNELKLFSVILEINIMAKDEDHAVDQSEKIMERGTAYEDTLRGNYEGFYVCDVCQHE